MNSRKSEVGQPLDAACFLRSRAVLAVVVLAGCATTAPPPTSPTQASDQHVSIDATPSIWPQANDRGVARISFLNRSGEERHKFGPAETVIAKVVLPSPLDTIRELDQDPDVQLTADVRTELFSGTETSAHSLGPSSYSICSLPRSALRHRNEFALGLFASRYALPTATNALDFVFGDLERGCSDPVRNAVVGVMTQRGSVTTLIKVYVAIYFTTLRGSTTTLAAGWFIVDVSDRNAIAARYNEFLARERGDEFANYRPPKSAMPSGEAEILDYMKRRYPDPSDAPIRAIPLMGDWVFADRDRLHQHMNAMVVFRRDNGSCVVRYYELVSGSDGNRRFPIWSATRKPDFDHELPCEHASP